MSTHYGHLLYTVLVAYKFHTKTQFSISHSVQEKRKMPVAPFHSHLNTFLQFLNQKYKNLC